MEKDYSKYFNKGNDCDTCGNQYLCGRDGDATGCRCADNGEECKYTERVEKVILLKVSVSSGFERLLGICSSDEEVMKMKSAFYEKWKVTYPRHESYQWIEKEYVLNELDD